MFVLVSYLFGHVLNTFDISSISKSRKEIILKTKNKTKRDTVSITLYRLIHHLIVQRNIGRIFLNIIHKHFNHSSTLTNIF